MVRFTVHSLGEHTIENLVVSGPSKDIISEMINMFLASYNGPPDEDLDYHFVQYVINLSHGQGQILEWTKPPPSKIH